MSTTRMTAAERREQIEAEAAVVFAERGYHGATIDEICRRCGISAPVLYDHFPSKLALHRRLLEKTRDELLGLWRAELGGDDPTERRVARAIDTWAAYVQAHPYVPRLFLTEPTGDAEAETIHREVRGQSQAALGAILGETTRWAGAADPLANEMAAEVMRSGLAGLAIWWSDHPDVPREQIVATALNMMWVGLDRLRRGETWDG
ncbi:MAG TPA: TetR/AcrR family transcriptional regulator [Thermoleophilaceae bacterium]|nr:TetR/AcrR family transcriptional regulator [Thermoleophilaceae bacterium]